MENFIRTLSGNSVFNIVFEIKFKLLHLKFNSIKVLTTHLLLPKVLHDQQFYRVTCLWHKNPKAWPSQCFVAGKRLGVRHIGREPRRLHTALLLRPVRVAVGDPGAQREEETSADRGGQCGGHLNVNVSSQVPT